MTLNPVSQAAHSSLTLGVTAYWIDDRDGGLRHIIKNSRPSYDFHLRLDFIFQTKILASDTNTALLLAGTSVKVRKTLRRRCRSTGKTENKERHVLRFYQHIAVRSCFEEFQMLDLSVFAEAGKSSARSFGIQLCKGLMLLNWWKIVFPFFSAASPVQVVSLHVVVLKNSEQLDVLADEAGRQQAMDPQLKTFLQGESHALQTHTQPNSITYCVCVWAGDFSCCSSAAKS